MDTWKPQWWSFYLPGLHAFPFLENNASTLYFQWPGLYLANTGVYWCHKDATLYWSSGIFKCFPYVTLWICSPFLCLDKFDPCPEFGLIDWSRFLFLRSSPLAVASSQPATLLFLSLRSSSYSSHFYSLLTPYILVLYTSSHTEITPHPIQSTYSTTMLHSSVDWSSFSFSHHFW